MARALVAVNDSPTLPGTMRAARVLTSVLDIDLTAVHVRAPASRDRSPIGDRVDLPVQLVSGEVIEQLLAALDVADVELGIVGAHDRRDDLAPLGHVARGLAQRTGTPLLVVPPASGLACGDRLRRALLPLDGQLRTTGRVAALVRRLQAAGIDIVVTHVLEADHLPAHVDDPAHTLDAWQREFAARHLVPGQQVQLRRGHAWEAIPACAQECGADLVVLAWSQHTEVGRGEVVRAVLVDPHLPVLLLPRRGTTVPDVGEHGPATSQRGARSG